MGIKSPLPEEYRNGGPEASPSCSPTIGRHCVLKRIVHLECKKTEHLIRVYVNHITYIFQVIPGIRQRIRAHCFPHKGTCMRV